MNPELKAKWIADLRANPDLQGQGALRTNDGKFCCLGRLCEVVGYPYNEDIESYYIPLEEGNEHFNNFNGELPTEILISLNLSSEAEGKLISMNDNAEMSFATIADWIEENL